MQVKWLCSRWRHNYFNIVPVWCEGLWDFLFSQYKAITPIPFFLVFTTLFTLLWLKSWANQYSPSIWIVINNNKFLLLIVYTVARYLLSPTCLYNTWIRQKCVKKTWHQSAPSNLYYSILYSRNDIMMLKIVYRKTIPYLTGGVFAYELMRLTISTKK